jgi:hypothetical protein
MQPAGTTCFDTTRASLNACGSEFVAKWGMDKNCRPGASNFMSDFALMGDPA